MNNKVKDLERVSFGIAAMSGGYKIYLCFTKQYLIADGFQTIIGFSDFVCIGTRVAYSYNP